MLGNFKIVARLGEDCQLTITSTGDADFQPAVLPKNTRAFYIQAKTNSARISFEGDNPVVGDHFLIPVGQGPVLILCPPLARVSDGVPVLNICSDAAAASTVVTILALE